MASKLYLDDYKEKARFIGEIVGQLDLALSMENYARLKCRYKCRVSRFC